MWPRLSPPLLTIAIFISNVYAHGGIAKFTVDGKQYKGIAPWEGDSPSPNNGPIRQVATNGPVKDLKSADIACGLDAQFAGGVADAKPGSALVFEWGNIGSKDGAWPHNVGPIMTYMALCKGSCTKFNGTDAQWFKIDQLGQKKDGTWYQGDLMAGKPITLSLPTDLPSGDYLLRHEIIALHLAESVGGAEFYPNCIQMRVTGGGSSTKQPDNTVSFPGAYKANDPGIRINASSLGLPQFY
ncbi:hypothetical protein EWM64_g6800 [Hericium alpestre]|uniref:lytic cellulose monooxygenase (C4-dehydrogenating) n=1 Tax=Hericium alpestre TaxID=135208 RepID=A0A4Y9ZR12_9AGAM|nr:hypothetical protein EWM64_g6800 [Hericium alpestre]